MLKVLDLFSGIGGFSLGLERTGGFKTVAFCEIEEFPRRVLAKHWPGVPIHNDVRKLKGSDVGAVDVICGGYPCQPFSLAGKRAGAADDRHLWPEMRRLVDECRPAWVIGENVAGHISMGLDAVLSDLADLGYGYRPFVIPALALGAPHQRNRVWVVAYAECERVRGCGHSGNVGATREMPPREQERQWVWADAKPSGQVVADANGERLPASWPQPDGTDGINGGGMPAADGWWSVEPNVGRVAHGVPSRVDRLRGLGNAVVPQIPEIIGRAILQAEGRS